MHQPPSRHSKEWLSIFQAYVEEHLHRTDLTTDDIAKYMNYSTRQLYRRVKAMTGKSPKNILREARLERAYQFLKEGKYPTVALTASAVGFKDTVYFAQEFQKKYGVRPSKI